jgi:hypothetical protein
MKVFLDRFGQLLLMFWLVNCIRSMSIARLTSGGKAYHDKNATINPNQEKKKTLPYLSNGLNIGTDVALWVLGLISGEDMRSLKKFPAMAVKTKSAQRPRRCVRR